MKRLALAVLLVGVGTAALGRATMARATTAEAAVATPDDLVDAAKDAKAKRRKSTTRVITNADVKKSKGKVAETKLAPLPAETAAPQPTLVEQQQARRKAEADTVQQLAAAKEKVAALEKELAKLEQQYYEENDLDRRDTEIVRRFNEVKAKLDTARADLEKLNPS
ncbi:MAG TPA: hypothetical protein VHK90_11425 [Thermoanaerobaculia bacterium]|nr:hypothetical protein [Thermoanaerobaculia bacterium]